MYKKQVRLFKWGYMINDNKNDAENEKNRSHRYDITRARSRYGHKCTIYVMCPSLIMAISIKQHLSITWN